MSFNLWGFLSICVIFGASVSILTMYFAHQKSMKEMEIEALKAKNGELAK